MLAVERRVSFSIVPAEKLTVHSDWGGWLGTEIGVDARVSLPPSRRSALETNWGCCSVLVGCPTTRPVKPYRLRQEV